MMRSSCVCVQILESEVAIMKVCSHPNIVNVKDIFETDDEVPRTSRPGLLLAPCFLLLRAQKLAPWVGWALPKKAQ